MLALVVSALLGLYLFLPDSIFDRFAFPDVRLKKYKKTTIEDVFSGVLTAGIPFVAAILLSRENWFIGHYPFGN